MESQDKVIAVTGSKGKLAPFVIGALSSAGYTIATDSMTAVPLDLAHTIDALYLTEQWLERFGRVDGLVALTGAYFPTELSDSHDFVEAMQNNVMPAVRVVSALIDELQAHNGSVIAVDAAEGLQPKEAGYRAGKAALDAYLRSLSFERPLIDVSYIKPTGPIDTDEKRANLSNLIVTLVKRELSHA